MSEVRSDALVFFGATGDLAYKKIFPALQAMVKRGHLDVPVIGVAVKSGLEILTSFAIGRETALKNMAAWTPRPSRNWPRSCTMLTGTTLMPRRPRSAKNSERAAPCPLPRNPARLIWNGR